MARDGSNESDETMFSADSPLSNDGDNLHGSSGSVLKKGPWTSAEDAILIDYVRKHGEGNWNAVQKQSGLSRCGKSCRLRWANHLRPNLKKGAFTPEEERLIIELHAKMGNKWARMAAHLPGRTDNEIKNYWNTRIKRRQRAGLPLYPPDLSFQVQQENEKNLMSPGLCGRNKGYNGILKTEGYDSLNVLPYAPEFPDISASGSLIDVFGGPQIYNFAPQMTELPRCTQERESMLSYRGSATYEASSFDKTQIYGCRKPQLFGFRYDPDHTKKLLPFGVNESTHCMSNGNFSASKPFTGAEKFELPSLQYQDSSLGAWDMAPESLESFDQSPFPGPLPAHCPSPRSSGLLEALLYEAKAVSKKENQFSGKDTSSTISHGDVTGDSGPKTCSTEIKASLYPTSPSSNSMGSTFNGGTPDNIGSSFEDMSVHHVKSEVVDQCWIADRERNHVDCSRPDAILGTFWLGKSASTLKEQGPVTDAIAALLGDDLGCELKNMPARTSAASPAWGLSSCNWNNMPAVCQMSDLP